jgi:hypothetical protein
MEPAKKGTDSENKIPGRKEAVKKMEKEVIKLDLAIQSSFFLPCEALYKGNREPV